MKERVKQFDTAVTLNDFSIKVIFLNSFFVPTPTTFLELMLAVSGISPESALLTRIKIIFGDRM